MRSSIEKAPLGTVTADRHCCPGKQEGPWALTGTVELSSSVRSTLEGLRPCQIMPSKAIVIHSLPLTTGEKAEKEQCPWQSFMGQAWR